MGLAVSLSLSGVAWLLPTAGKWAEFARVVLPAGVGLAVYLGLAAVLRVEEIPLLYAMVRVRMVGTMADSPQSQPRL
jgi:hypothetical protein